MSDEQILRMVNTNLIGAIRTTKAFIPHFRQKRTDFFTRSFDVGRHPAYDGLVDKVMSAVTDPKQMESYSTPEQIAEVVYEAATDGKDRLRYVAGADAKATYATRLERGDEAFRRAIRQRFFGAENQEGA